MKTASNEVFELIQALSEKEKNLFRKYCLFKSEGENTHSYLKLFDAYVKQRIPDENKVKQSCRLSNFTRVKNYLHQQLIRFLADVDSHSFEKEIFDLLLAADKLRHYSLFRQSLSLLNKAEKKVKEIDLQSLLLIVKEKKANLYNAISSPDSLAKIIDYYSNEHDVILKRTANEGAYMEKAFRLKLGFLQEASMPLNNERRRKLKPMLDSLLKDDDVASQTITAQIYYHSCCGTYYAQLQQTDKARDHFEQCATLFEKNEPARSYYSFSYLTTLNNLLYCYSAAKDYTQCNLVFASIKKIKAESRREELYIKQVIGLHETDYLYWVKPANRKNRLKELEREIGDDFKLFQPHYMTHVLWGFSRNYFDEGDYKKALSFIISIDELVPQNILEEVRAIIKVYQLLLYFELGKNELLEYLIPNTKRYLNKHKYIGRFEKLILLELKKLMSSNNRTDDSAIYQRLYAAFEEIKNNPDENRIFRFLDLSDWLQRKMTRLK